jgi:iron complex transport system substrate-binding protein
MRYAKNLRLDRARHDLITTGKSMNELAKELGFSNQFHFSREFKAKFGVSPTAYRRAQRGLVV